MLAILRKSASICLGLLAGLASFANLALAQPTDCPQPRFTGKAPDDYYARANPIAPSEAATKAASQIFLGEGRVASCYLCHGKKGDGRGTLSSQYDPPPRNFACAATVKGVPDGQLFWIIRYGSPGTAMPPHPKLKDEQIWQVVLYLREMAK